MSAYDTALSPEQQKQFLLWKALVAPRDSGYDYDLPGAMLQGYGRGLTGYGRGEGEHLDDTFKKPNHPTFSEYSMYAPAKPAMAGRWEGDTYKPTVIRYLLDALGKNDDG